MSKYQENGQISRLCRRSGRWVTPVIRAASLSCENAEKRKNSRHFGVHPGNAG